MVSSFASPLYSKSNDIKIALSCFRVNDKCTVFVELRLIFKKSKQAALKLQKYVPQQNRKKCRLIRRYSIDIYRHLDYNRDVINISQHDGFFAAVYAVVKQIPCGKVSTYGQIARLIGSPKAARQVGWALHCNPEPFVIPCHRVVNRFGELAPSFAFGGVNIQAQLLTDEGITVCGNKVDLTQYLWKIDF